MEYRVTPQNHVLAKRSAGLQTGLVQKLIPEISGELWEAVQNYEIKNERPQSL
jgi:hypothetical protein